MKLLTAENIVAGYLPGINILNGIDFAAEQGEITTIIGANGAGKSTFLKALYGFLKPKTGKIFYKGEDITSQNPEFLIRKGISFVPQQTKSLFADMTVSENLEMGCWVRRNDKEFVKEAIERVYDNHAFIYEAKDVPAKLLSGGQQRILELERSMLLKPELLILDEPTATLSPKISDSIYELLLEMKKRDTTIVLVDQNVSKSFDISDHLYIFDMGKTKNHGSKAEMQGQLRAIVEEWIAVDDCKVDFSGQGAELNG